MASEPPIEASKSDYGSADREILSILRDLVAGPDRRAGNRFDTLPEVLEPANDFISEVGRRMGIPGYQAPKPAGPRRVIGDGSDRIQVPAGKTQRVRITFESGGVRVEGLTDGAVNLKPGEVGPTDRIAMTEFLDAKNVVVDRILGQEA